MKILGKEGDCMNWISVEKELPQDGVPVMVLFDSGKQALNIKYYSELGLWSAWSSATHIKKTAEKTGRSIDTRKAKGGEVTHWIPIPEPPPPKPNIDTPTQPTRGKYKHLINCPQCEKDLHVCCCGCGCGQEADFAYCPYCRQALKWEC